MMRVIVALFGGISVLLVTILVIGLVLPNSWEAEHTIELEHAPATLFPFMADLARWDAWTAWSEFESVTSTPSSGVGATRTWDDDAYGGGQIRLTDVTPHSSVHYRVELDGGAWVEGAISLSENGGKTIVTWTESGDFGWNPLMGFMARKLPESQKLQMSESLIKLAEAATAEPARAEEQAGPGLEK